MFALKQNDRNQPQSQAMPGNTKATRRVQTLIIKNMQDEAIAEENQTFRRAKEVLKSSPLLKLSPILDSEGLLRIGGPLDRANLP